MKTAKYFLLLALGLMACQKPQEIGQSTENPQTQTQENKTLGKIPNTWAEPSPSVEELIQALNQAQNFETIDLGQGFKGQGLANREVRGRVSAVCRTAGCWLSLESPNGQELTLHIKDKAFKVSTKLQGQEVRAKGHAYIRRTSIEEQRFELEQQGASAQALAAITQDLVEYEMSIETLEILNQ